MARTTAFLAAPWLARYDTLPMNRTLATARTWLLILPLALAASCFTTPDRVPRPQNWAQPVAKVGLPNLHRVDKGLYRGAQPDEEGFHELKAMGIRTVVNVRSGGSGRNEIGEVELDYEAIPMSAWSIKDEDVIRFLQIATDPDRRPVFVHCKHGADRTGALCAMYRIVVCGRTREQALDEMTGGAYGFHAIFSNITRYVREADIEKIARESGVAMHR